MNPPPLSDFLTSAGLLAEAFTHRSYCNEHPGLVHNERLEFLGDSVLSVIISDRLFRLLPAAPEGELTTRRSHLVQTGSLAAKARWLHLNTQIRLSRGEEDSGGRSNSGILADTFEAVLGAIYIESGFPACRRFLDLVFPDSEILSDRTYSKDPKSRLQELSQAAGWGTPIYRTVASAGPDHAKTFEVAVVINDHEAARGTGPSKQKAETAAAQNSISALFPDQPLC